MSTIQREHLVQSVAEALQFISYYQPADYLRALGRAYEREQSGAAKDAIAQILTNSRMCAEGHRPICQDTGRSEEHTSELQSRRDLVCRLLLEKKKKKKKKKQTKNKHQQYKIKSRM